QLGSIGYACRQLTTGNAVHLNADSLAVLSHRREAPVSGEPVGSLAVTQRVGGSATDYQLVEHDGAGQARMTLRVSRRVPIAALSDVKDHFLVQLRAFQGGQIASRMWQHADALEVVHEDPIMSGHRGKILPLHVLGSGVTSELA